MENTSNGLSGSLFCDLSDGPSLIEEKGKAGGEARRVAREICIRLKKTHAIMNCLRMSLDTGLPSSRAAILENHNPAHAH